MRPEDDYTIPNATRHDGAKTIIYLVIGLGIATLLIAGTIWLFVAG